MHTYYSNTLKLSLSSSPYLYDSWLLDFSIRPIENMIYCYHHHKVYSQLVNRQLCSSTLINVNCVYSWIMNTMRTRLLLTMIISIIIIIHRSTNVEADI